MKSFLVKAALLLGGLISSIFGLHKELAKEVSPESQTAQAISSQVIKPTVSPSSNVGVGTTTPTQTPTPPKQTTSNGVSKSEVESIINSKLNSLLNSDKLKGPKGDKGDKGDVGQNGQTGITTSYTTPSGLSIPAQNLTVSYTPPGASNPGSIGSITYFSSKENKVDSLTVSQSANINNLVVSGSTSLGNLSFVGALNINVSPGTDLVSNGSFDGSASGWTLGSGWFYTNGGASHTSGDTTGSPGIENDLHQTLSLTIGRVYSVTFTIRNRTQGGVNAWLQEVDNFNAFEENGTFTFLFTAVSSSDELAFDPDIGGDDPSDLFDGVIDDITVKEAPSALTISDGATTNFQIDNLGNVRMGELEYDETPTPLTFSMGGTYSDEPGENAKFKLYDDADNIFGFGISEGQLDYIVSATDFDHVFYADGDELMRITGEGNVGIGTDDPFFKLHVAGDAWFEDFIQGPFANGRAFGFTASDSSLRWSLGTDSGGSGNFIIGQNGNDWSDEGTRFSINRNGQVGIATTSPWRTFSVTGTVGFDGITAGAGAGSLCLSANKEVLYSAGATCTVSSERFKYDIATSTTGLDFVNKLRPVTFFYNDDIGVPGEQYGFIAEEVEQLDPKLVVHDKDNLPFSVKYENLTAILAKAIQEQQEEIQAIKTNASSTGPIIHDESSFLSDLQYYSGQLLSGIWHFVEIITDKITATLGVFKRVETEDLQAKRFCLGETCVTEAEFKALLEKNSITSSNNSSPTPTPTSTPTSIPEPTYVPSEIVEEPIPTPSISPTPTLDLVESNPEISAEINTEEVNPTNI